MMDKNFRKSWKQATLDKPAVIYDTEVKISLREQIFKHITKLWKTLKSSFGVFILIGPFTLMTYTFVKLIDYYVTSVRPQL